MSLALSVFTLIRLLGWEIELGPLGTWFGAIVSTAAVIVALWVALDGRSERAKQEIKAVYEAESRALRRASRIAIMIQPNNIGPDLQHSWGISVTNGDDRPIFDLIFHSGLTLATNRKSVRSTPVTSATSRAITVKPGGTWSTDVAVDHIDAAGHGAPVDERVAVYDYAPAVEFVDDDGYRFCWDNSPRDRTSSGRASGSWSIKNDSRKEYPEDQPIFGQFYEISRMDIRKQEDEITDAWSAMLREALVEFESKRVKTPNS
ncbi:hypothetical protein ACWIGW_07720 [Nocardia brasiliensis]